MKNIFIILLTFFTFSGYGQTFHEQGGTTYKIEDNLVKGWFGESEFTKPFWNGSSIEESWTPADQIIEDSVFALFIVDQSITILETDGREFARLSKSRIGHYVNKGYMTAGGARNFKKDLAAVFRCLRDGDWDVAEDKINNISPPSNPARLTLYNEILLGIETYLASL